MEIDLTGKKVLITGGSGELGRVIAVTMARCGADVAVHYFGSEEKAERTAAEIRALGKQSKTFQADLTNKESVDAMREDVFKRFGKPDILINNAVIQYQWKSVLEQEIEDYQSQFDSCVMQTVYMTKAFVPHMMKQRYGRVIVTNTECAALADGGTSAYVAGKKALDGVVRCLAKEVGSYGITVNQVAPGWVITERDRINHSEKQPDYDKQVPLGHRGQDQDIANAMAFLASDLASFITGIYLPVTGGRVMPGI